MVAELLDEVAAHYGDRRFPASALARLQQTIQTSIREDRVVFHGVDGLFHLDKALIDLRGRFPRLSPQRRSDAPPQAILGFSFGYRMPGRADGAAAAGERLHGPNNLALAGICGRLKRQTGLPLCVQSEISDALDNLDSIAADYVTPVEDMGTDRAIRYFLSYLGACKGPVYVVAHCHHLGRCLMRVESLGKMVGIPSGEDYDGYDVKEAQPRAVSPDVFIISDFVSLASAG